jgi:hypothetical protein
VKTASVGVSIAPMVGGGGAYKLVLAPALAGYLRLDGHDEFVDREEIGGSVDAGCRRADRRLNVLRLV